MKEHVTRIAQLWWSISHTN